MTKRPIQETVTTTPKEDAERLRVRLEGLEISQAEFAAQFGIGSQAQYWQYLNPDKPGGRPLNVMAAIGFARGIDALRGPCTVGDFSPYLQQVIDRISVFKTPNSVHQNVANYDPHADLRKLLGILSQLDQTRRAEVEKYAEERLKLQQSEEPQNYSARRLVIPHQARGGRDITNVILISDWKAIRLKCS